MMRDGGRTVQTGKSLLYGVVRGIARATGQAIGRLLPGLRVPHHVAVEPPGDPRAPGARRHHVPVNPTALVRVLHGIFRHVLLVRDRGDRRLPGAVSYPPLTPPTHTH